MIEVRDLRYAHAPRPGGGPGFALHLPAWALAPGGRAAVVGPSGSGKSTLLGLLSGELAPRGGALVVLGEPLHALDERRRRAFRAARLGLVLQGAPLLPALGALDNVLLPYRLGTPLRLDAAARRRAEVLLDELGLQGLSRARPDALSVGERQRVSLARALVTEPALVLADEPTAGLDPEATDAAMALMEGLVARRGSALVMVTHDPRLAARFPEVLDARRLRVAP